MSSSSTASPSPTPRPRARSPWWLRALIGLVVTVVGLLIAAALVVGLVLALSWTPCTTAFLSSVIAMAASAQNATMLSGMGLLAVYALGMMIPFLLFMALSARLGGTVALHYQAATRGAQLLRVHDVAENRQALRVWRGLRDAALTA